MQLSPTSLISSEVIYSRQNLPVLHNEIYNKYYPYQLCFYQRDVKRGVKLQRITIM